MDFGADKTSGMGLYLWKGRRDLVDGKEEEVEKKYEDKNK